MHLIREENHDSDGNDVCRRFEGSGQVLAAIDQLRKTNHDKNAAGFAALFAADAADYNLAPPLSHRGIDRHKKQAWFDYWDGPVEVAAGDFEVTVSGDVAFCHGFMHMKATSKGGDWSASGCVPISSEAGTWSVEDHTCTYVGAVLY
jgi:ketosteroid isomerase-like protein